MSRGAPSMRRQTSNTKERTIEGMHEAPGIL